MKTLLVALSVLLSVGCLTPLSDKESPTVNQIDSNEDDFDSDYDDLDEDTQSCRGKFTHHLITFNGKVYMIALPVACNPEPYIEKGMPSDWSAEENQPSNPVDYKAKQSFIKE